MILPIYAFGQPVLKKVAKEITPDYPDLKELIDNMWETMYGANGVGLAAPQVGLAIRIFLVDTVQVMEEDKKEEGIKQAFINAQVVETGGEPWTYEEGCLSIPDVRADVKRDAQVKIRYVNEKFEEQERIFSGINARVILHEYDHIEGILFTEHLKPLKKRMIKRRLENIKKGKVDRPYKMKFARLK